MKIGKNEPAQFRIIRTDTEEYYVPYTGGRQHTFGKGWERIYCSWTHDCNDFWLCLAGTWPTREEAIRAMLTADDIHNVNRDLLEVTQMVPFPE